MPSLAHIDIKRFLSEEFDDVMVLFLASPPKFGQLYVKHTRSEILNLWHVLHFPFRFVYTVKSGNPGPKSVNY
jgi:hypothetical protein